jgi:photosystem II stability/assembly factor-like uncharacterized protein
MKKNYEWLLNIGNVYATKNKLKLNACLKLGSKIVIGLILLFNGYCLYGQQNTRWSEIKSQLLTPTASFSTINNTANDYFDSVINNNGVINSSELKQFNRWAYYWKNRVYYEGSTSGGDFSKPAQYALKKLNNEITICNSSPNSAQWESHGPVNDNVFKEQNIGMVCAVKKHPTIENKIFAGTKFSGLWVTEDGGVTWQNKTDYLRIPNLGISCIVFDPNNSNIIYLGTGSNQFGYSSYGVGILKSLDGGNTWTPSGINTIPTQNEVISKICIDNTGSVIYAIGERKIYKTTNTGNTWSLIYTLPTEPSEQYTKFSFVDLEINPANSNYVYASTGNSSGGIAAGWVLISTNGGSTFDDKTPIGTRSFRTAIDVRNNDNTVYIAFANVPLSTSETATVKILKTTNNGTNWTEVGSADYTTSQFTSPNPNNLNGKLEFEVSNNDASVIYLGGNVMYKSSNGGNNYSTISEYSPLNDINSTHADIRALELITKEEEEQLIIGNDGGIAISNNSGGSWTNINGNLSITMIYSFDKMNNNDNLYAGAQDNGTFGKTGENWEHEVKGCDGGFTKIIPSNNEKYYSDCNGAISINSTYTFNPEGKIPNTGQIDPNDDTYLWLGTKNLNKYNSTNNTWTRIWTNSNSNSTSLSVIAVAPNVTNSTIIYLAFENADWNNAGNKFLLSNNGGNTFTDITSNLPQYIDNSVTSIAVNPKNPYHLFVSFNGYKASTSNTSLGINRVIEMISTNQGLTWIVSDISNANGLPPHPVLSIKYQEGTNDVIYAGTDAGVYVYNRLTNMWLCYNSNLPLCTVTDMKIDYCNNKLFISTFGRGIYSTKLWVNTQEITTSETWYANSERFVNNNLEIKPGVTLTILGNVSFAANVHLIINPGAKVEVINGKLYNKCGKMWGGILVEGNPNTNQFPTSNQGYLVLINATIENANTAISTKSFYFVNGVATTRNWSKEGGGIIVANNSTFKNNNRHVEFLKYKNIYPNGQE